ncbi:MAG: hypothetical protein LKI24_14180 [Acidipropionibacterium sp.]|jgi:hypothetical protein|nr:hypothetical protein [Acidipropionibacterium sp.]
MSAESIDPTELVRQAKTSTQLSKAGLSDGAGNCVACGGDVFTTPGTEECAQVHRQAQGIEPETLPANPDPEAPAPGWEAQEPPDAEAGEEKKERGPSVASQLVETAEESYTFGRTAQDHAYGVAMGSHVARMLRGSGSLRKDLAGRYWDDNHRVASAQALADALLVIEAKAMHTDPVDVHIRVAEVDGALWLDMGDESERVIRVDAKDWKVVDHGPVLFNRTGVGLPLPDPDPTGSITELWRLLNISKPDQPLVLGWLLSAWLLVNRPCPILGLFGEQGTAKTSAGKILASLVDPTSAEVRKPPSSEDAWITAAVASRVVALDNLSHLSDDWSNTYCRAVTRDADVRRKLYTDSETEVFKLKKAILMTGIDLGGLRGDFAERLLRVELETIPGDKRKTDTEMAEAWQAARPRILGALLSITSKIMSVLPRVRLESKPRMADFAVILAALDMMMPKGRALERYLSQLADLAADTIAADPFITAMGKRLNGEFRGTSAELLDYMDDMSLTVGKQWPATAKSLTARLKKAAPSMRKVGWQITKTEPGGRDHTSVWTIRPPEEGSPDGGREVVPVFPFEGGNAA